MQTANGALVRFSSINGRTLALSRDHVTVFVLFAINLLNYMDRFTIAAVLTDVQSFFGINDIMVGLLQTVFICSYMIFAPICGYLGDRYSRKIIMITGIFVWSMTVLISSFVPKNNFWLFFVLRGFVGIGEASYSTIAPVIIADLFTNERRTKMLMLFFFAIPVGSGLGYIVGANLSAAFGSWQWGVRLTPVLGVVCMLLLIFIVQEPVRGAAEKGTRLRVSSWLDDVKYLLKNQSFVLSSMGFVCIAFVSGSVSWWMPSFIFYAGMKQGISPVKSRINLIFGVITCLSGLIGVSVGSLWAARWQKSNKRAACYICAIGLFACTPFYFAAINLVDRVIDLTWIFSFCAITCLCLNWAILSDLLLQVVIPPRRATANAAQILVGHLLGDASSPYIVGHISEIILAGRDSYVLHFYSLKYALLVPPFALVLGGFFFLWCSLHVEHNKRQVEVAIASTMMDNNDGTEFPNSDDAQQNCRSTTNSTANLFT